MNGEDPALWRLDSLAQDMRSIAVDQDNGKQLQPKGSLTGLFKGFSALSSNVKSTKGQLQRIMTVQLAALPLNSDDSATSKDNLPGTASSNKSIAPSGLSPTQHASDAGTPGAAPEAAALTAAADLALQEAADDLKSSVTAGIPTHAQQIHTIPQTIYEGQTLSTTSSGVSALDADISVFAAYGATKGPSFTAAIGGTPLSGTPSRSGSQTAFSVGRTVSPMSSHVSPRLSRRFTNMSRSSGVRLQPSATLQRMETSNAWWELHELEKQQSCNSAADTDDDFVLDEEQYSSIAELLQQPKAAALPAAPTQSGNNQDASKLNGSRSSSTFGSGLLKTLGGLTSGSFVGGVTAKLAAVLNIVSNNNTPIYSGHLKKAPHTTVSTDGWTLHLLHIRDTSLRAEQRRNYPILMCPGLASSGTGTFDLLPKESIADFLAADGYDVWVIDLRGNGKADKQSRVDLELEWNIDDYLVQDVPAVIEYVLKQTKAEMLHWMGHSMGGMLGSGLCSQGGKWGRKLRSVMLVGSGCFGDGSWHVLLKKLVAPIVTFGFPAHYSCQALALLSNTPAALSVFETLFYWCPNMDKSARKALLHTCFNFIPQRLLGQFLASHGSAEGLSSWNGNFLYADPDVLAKCKVPCLGLNGDYDLFCPAAGGAKNVLLFGGPKKHLVFGPSYGHEFHYGHFDVIIGKNAQLEVWPNIQEWLAEHDEPVMSANDLWDDLDKES